LPLEISYSDVDSHLEDFRKQSSRNKIEDSTYKKAKHFTVRIDDFRWKESIAKPY